MRDYEGKTDTTVAAVRAGGDLQVVINRWDGGEHSVWEVTAFDSNGNPLETLGAFLSGELACSMLPSLVEIAREAYGSEAARGMDDFNLVAWRVRPENGPGWDWAAGDLDLSQDLGVPRQH